MTFSSSLSTETLPNSTTNVYSGHYRFISVWGAEGAGVAWPGNDAALLVLVPVVALVGAAYIFWLRSRKIAAAAPAKESEVVA